MTPEVCCACPVYFVALLLAVVIAENPASHRKDVRNGDGVSRVVVATSGYSAMTLIQNTGRVIVSNAVLRLTSHTISSS